MLARHARPRGQTLVLGAMTMLVLALMVVVTLEVGQRAKHKMEAQVLADVAAYNQAVNTARAFNQVALMNRASAAIWVSLAATQSLISWSGQSYRYDMNLLNLLYTPGTKNAQRIDTTACKIDPGNALYTQLINWVDTVQATLRAADKKAADRVKKDQALAGSLGGMAAAEVSALSGPSSTYGSSNVSRHVIQTALPGAAYAETPLQWHAGTDPAVPDTEDSRHQLFVVMGSRGNAFVTNRGAVPVPVDELPSPIPYYLTPLVSPTGGGGSGFGKSPAPGTRHDAESWSGVDGMVSWADDDAEGDTDVTFHCKRDGKQVPLRWKDFTTITYDPAGVPTWVVSTDQFDDNDAHHYFNLNDPIATEAPDTEHTLYCSTPPTPCHGIFGGFRGYDEANVANAGKADGQPVLSSVLTLNSSGLTRPWDYDTSVHMFRDGATAHFQTHPPGYNKLGVTSTSLAYYHRTGHAAEPPNFFNPFWRATIVSGRLADSAGQKSVSTLMHEQGLSAQEQAINGLIAHGYRGY